MEPWKQTRRDENQSEGEGSGRCTMEADVGLRDVDARMWHSREGVRDGEIDGG